MADFIKSYEKVIKSGNAQPNYVLLSPSGELLVPVRGYDLSIDGFVNFLQSGLDAYSAK